MEAIAALSLASNVIQVVDFGLKAASMCHEAYKTGHVKPELKDVTSDFRAAYEALRQSTSQNSQITAEDQAILDLGQKCDDSANRLLVRLSKLKGPQGQKSRAVGRTVKALWESSKIEDLQKQFDSHRKVLETRLLVDLRRRHNLIAIKQAEGFDHLTEAVQRLVIKLDSGETRLHAIITEQHNETRELVVNEFGKLRLEMKSEVDHKMVLQSLHFPEMMSRKENVQDTYSNTFAWILDPPGTSHTHDEDSNSDNSLESSDNADSADGSEFSESSQSYNDIPPHPSLFQWLSTQGGIYWICGKAGSGKSTLMRFICEDKRTKSALTSWSNSTKVDILEYFFWSPGVPLQKSIIGLLRAIILQIFQAHPALTQLFGADLTAGIPAWTEKRLLCVLFTIIQQETFPLKFCLFIDGLDEMEGILICTQIHLQELTRKDIEVFVSGKLKERQSIVPLSVQESNELVWSISNKADGVFLWVSLATASILDGIGNEDNFLELRSRLQELPQELNDLYSTLLSRIGPQYRLQAMRYFQLLLLDQDGLELKLSVLLLSLVDLKLPELSGSSGRRAESSTESRDATIRQCNRTLVHLLQRCGGLLHLEFEDASGNQISFERDLVRPYKLKPCKMERKGQIPMQVDSLAEGDGLHVQFLHRTVFEYLKGWLKSPEFGRLGGVQGNDNLPLWNPAVARAEAYVNKIRVMCQFTQVSHGVKEVNYFFPEITHLAASLAAIRMAKQPITFLPEQQDLLLKLEFEGTQLMSLITEKCGLDANIPWYKLLARPHDPSPRHFPHQMFSTVLELYTFAGFNEYSISKISRLSSDECTSLLQCALHSLMWDGGIRYQTTCFLEGVLSLFRSRVLVVLKLLDAGADPNSKMDETEGSYFHHRGMLQPRSTIRKSPLCPTAWSFVLTMLTNEFYDRKEAPPMPVTRWHNYGNLSLWRNIISSFVNKGADTELVMSNLAITMGAMYPPGDSTHFFEFTFIFDGSVLPIVTAYFSDHEADLCIVNKLQSLNAPWKVGFKCLQLRIADLEDTSEGVSITQDIVTLLGLPTATTLFEGEYELESLGSLSGPPPKYFSWEIRDLINELASDIFQVTRPIWMKDDEQQFPYLWSPGSGNEIETEDFFAVPGGAPSPLPKVLQEVMRILNNAAEAGNLKQSPDFAYRNSDDIIPKKQKEIPNSVSHDLL